MRLTNENYENDCLSVQKTRILTRPDGGISNWTQATYNNKLWEYVKEREDIEDELGIDLITSFKALEIIKEKEINVRLFKECKTREEYNREVRDLYYQRLCLTQEEFNLLKEVLL